MKLIIDTKAEQKRKLYCTLSPRNEWSGVSFYEYNKEKDTIIVKDIIILASGNSAHTTMFPDETIATYKIQNKLWGCHTGLIHSHNVMSAFFSEEDNATIRKEISEDFPYFLSIVVNNAGEYVAKLAQKAKTIQNIITKTWLVNSNENEFYNSEESKKEFDSSVIITIADITVPECEIDDDDELRRIGNILSEQYERPSGNHECSSDNCYNPLYFQTEEEEEEEEREERKEERKKKNEQNTIDMVARILSGQFTLKNVKKSELKDYADHVCEIYKHVEEGYIELYIEMLARRIFEFWDEDIRSLLKKYIDKNNKEIIETIIDIIKYIKYGY